MFAKRLFDLIVTVPAMLVALPFMLIIAVWVKFGDGGPVLYVQQRVGKRGRLFGILKFRTMVVNSDSAGPAVTAKNDSRITPVGRILRKSKLDELPQLFNVIMGDMSLVGPRPEVLEYIDCYPQAAKEKVLSVRPGITDRAAIEFRNEETLLANSSNPERTYVEEVLPVKIDYYLQYVSNRTFLGDIRILLKTIMVVLFK